MTAIILTEIDKENWGFVLYKGGNGKWYVDFPYSPVSFVDLFMLIELSELEKAKAEQNRQFLCVLSDLIKNDFNSYLSRALNRNNFIFND
ncbi:hypothetical protein [Desertivirga arenae]|uniref:hypothetical protein n=1 Tax=Desertivirga arenae TaxID=2810309 RepID=UPI001A972D05|nr:hypothetical protein [Pedobacter sp. SYSU D00823]